MTVSVPKVDGLTRERLLEFANARPDAGQRERLIELAGKWKHNWIPLDEIAAAIKAKRMKGDGIRRPSAPSPDTAVAVRPAGKTRFDPKGAAAHTALTSGVRGKQRPPRQAPRGVKETHPVGAPVLASQPGIDRETRGHVTGHTDNGMVKVQYANHRGEQTIGTFNPHHTRVLTGQQAAEHDFQHGGPTAAPGLKPTVTVAVPVDNLKQYRDSELRNWLTRGDAGMKERARAELNRRHAENAPSVRGSTQADRDKAFRAQTEAQTAAAISTLGSRDMADLRRLAESKAVKPKVRKAALAELRKRETPEQTAERIGMTFPKPTVKSHAVIGEGTVEKSGPTPGTGPHGLKPGDAVTAHNVGISGDMPAKYIGLDVNGKPRIQYSHGGAIQTTSVRAEQIRPDPGKAPAAAEPAAPKKPRKPSALHQEYRSRREEQDRRFEAHVGGGIAATDTHTQEYRDYFGVGDHSTSPQEQRVTFRSFLEERRQGNEYQRRQQQGYDAGLKLGARHGGQDDSTAHEDEYRHAAAGHDEEMFGSGYRDGIIAGSAKAEAQRQQSERSLAELAYGQARAASSAASNAAVRAGTADAHNAAVHAHVATGRAALAAGRRQEAEHHIKMAQSHKDAANTYAAREAKPTAPPAPPAAAPPASDARRFGEAANAGERANIGQAQAQARRAAQGPPQQGEMFGGHGEHQADMFDQPAEPTAPPAAAAPARAGITVEHSGDGTLVHGTERGDTATTEALKGQGFKWSRNLDAWYLPRTWSEPTREARVRGLEARLGDKVTVQRGELAKSTSGTEERAQRIARAGELAQAHTDRAGKLDAEAQARFDASHKATAGIPFGQPILVGHHSQRGHERALEKSHSNMRAGVDAAAAAEQERSRAESAAARGRLEQDPKFLARRLDRNQAEHRKVLRTLERANPADEHTRRLHAIRQDLEGKIGADQAALLEHGGGQHSKQTITPGDVITYRGSAHVVHKTNAKTVTVPHWEPRLAAAGYTDTIPYTQIEKHGSLDAAKPESLRKMLEQPNLPPAVRSRIAAILRDKGESL